MRNVFGAVRSALRVPWGLFGQSLVQARKGITFHLLVDITTLLASVATVYTLLLLLHDRRDQANVIAWQLLQNYVQHEPAAHSEMGQSFALTTLAKGDVPLDGLNASNSWVKGANLRCASLFFVSFNNAWLVSVNLAYASLSTAELDGARINSCDCEGTHFTYANLHNAKLVGGNYKKADFVFADISDMDATGQRAAAMTTDTFHPLEVKIFKLRIKLPPPKISSDAFANACYQKGHKPTLPSSISPPRDPQGTDCIDYWGAQWAERDKASGLQPPH